MNTSQDPTSSEPTSHQVVSAPRTPLRIAVLAVLTMSVSAPALAAGTTAAAAAKFPSQGCNAAPWGLVCVSVEGSGLKVRKISAIRDKASFDGICNYHAGYVIFHNHKQIEKSKIKAVKDCSAGRAWIDFKPKKAAYPDNSSVCVTFWEENDSHGWVKQGGSPCVKVTR